MKKTITGIIIGAVFALAAASYAPIYQAAEQSCNGKVANLNFNIKDLDGKDVALSSFKGNVILLTFWATWCPPCKEEIPDLIGLYDKYKQSGLVVLGVSVDESSADVKKFVKQYKVNFPVVMGYDRQDVQNAFGPVPAYPTTVVISRDGKICFQHTGSTPLEKIEEKIKAFL
jgi:peroxiredoxin